MKVFVTGHRGFIGVHLVELLKARGHSVTGCDLNLFGGCAWENFVRPDVELFTDIRQLRPGDLEGHDCCIHLAALSNDPMGEIDVELTRRVNGAGSVDLARAAKAAGVEKFLLASSCAMYGRGDRRDLDETASFNPVSAYAQSKIDAERGIGALADGAFHPAYLRCATAYGHSPMLRIDLVANNLLACAVALSDIRILSDGTPWRPLIHCRDIAYAFIAFSEAPAPLIHDTAVNIGANGENYQVNDVAQIVKRIVPKAAIVVTGESGHDPRDYRVNFDRLGALLPEFTLRYTLERGLEELYQKMVEHDFNESDFRGDRFVRVRTLHNRLSLLDPLSYLLS